MTSPGSATKIAVIGSAVALLSFLSRTFLDYYVVYDEVGVESIAGVTLFNLAFFGAWIWALLAASHGSRRAMFVLLFFCLILVLYGVASVVALCPAECRAAWPLGSASIWSNLAIGIPAAWLAWRGARETK